MTASVWIERNWGTPRQSVGVRRFHNEGENFSYTYYVAWVGQRELVLLVRWRGR